MSTATKITKTAKKVTTLNKKEQVVPPLKEKASNEVVKEQTETQVEVSKKKSQKAPKEPKHEVSSSDEKSVEKKEKKEKKTEKKTKKTEVTDEKKTTKKSKKDQESQAGEKEKKPKKVNNKPTISETCGLNLSVAKVKNIISNLCINSKPYFVLKELKEHRVFVSGGERKEVDDVMPKRPFTFTLEGLSDETMEYLLMAENLNLVDEREEFAKLKIKAFDKDTKANFLFKRKEAMKNHALDELNHNLFQSRDFDHYAFNLSFDSKFYKDMRSSNWKHLKNEKLYKHCTNLISKTKIRFSVNSRVYITAFVEHIIKQLITVATINCVNDKKKIIKLEHALDTSSEEFNTLFPLYPVITHLDTFRSYQNPEESEDVESDESHEEEEKQVEKMEDEKTEEEKPEEKPEEESVDRKYQFKYYVSELCRTVKLELSRENNKENFVESPYYTTSVSKVFKTFCSSIIVDLIKVFGEVLKDEVSTRNVKTVNYIIIEALLKNVHTLFNVKDALPETIKFIQEKFLIYQQYTEDRRDNRGKGTPESHDEEVEDI